MTSRNEGWSASQDCGLLEDLLHRKARQWLGYTLLKEERQSRKTNARQHAFGGLLHLLVFTTQNQTALAIRKSNSNKT